MDELDGAAARSRRPILAVAAAIALLGGALIAVLATGGDEDRVDTRAAGGPTDTPALEALGRQAPATYAATRDDCGERLQRGGSDTSNESLTRSGNCAARFSMNAVTPSRASAD